jgi:hypothetical protein
VFPFYRLVWAKMLARIRPTISTITIPTPLHAKAATQQIGCKGLLFHPDQDLVGEVQSKSKTCSNSPFPIPPVRTKRGIGKSDFEHGFDL